MADANDRFFDRSPDESPTLDEPPSKYRGVIIGGVGLVLAAAAAFMVLRKTETAALWIVNAGPESATVQLAGGEPQPLEAGRLLELPVPLAPRASLELTVGSKKRSLEVPLHPPAEKVTLVDVGADGAFAVVDVSAHYAQTPSNAVPALEHLSKPAEVHELPFAASALVRPGRALPEKGSWELNVFMKQGKTLTMYKVFRVDPRRLEDEEKLKGAFAEAIASGNAAGYENMLLTRTSTKPRTSIFDP